MEESAARYFAGHSQFAYAYAHAVRACSIN